MAVYKALPAAREYMARHITRSLRGEARIGEEDVRAKVILIHKSGRAEDPANYRPISLLNVDYKILTATISSIILEGLAEWMIPKEQLARKGV